MPVLSFPCTIHPSPDGSGLTHRRVWIKGHDLRALALAATAQLGVTEDQCEYGVVLPETANSHVFLEISHLNGDALVGPMAGPLPPSTMPLDEHFPLDALIVHLGLETLDGAAPGRHGERPGRYTVVVTYLPIWQRQPFPPDRQARESDAAYQERFERIRIERSSRQGIHVVAYDRPAQEWTAHDFERLFVLMYRLLPTDEPRWRESGAIRQAKFVDPGEGRRVTIAPCLQLARGEYVAHLRLPAFPARALADWLATRHYDINLRHPLIKLELVSRGWRSVDDGRIPAATTRSDDSTAPVSTRALSDWRQSGREGTLGSSDQGQHSDFRPETLA